MSSAIILGNDWLLNNRVLIDYKYRSLTINDVLVDPSLITFVNVVFQNAECEIHDNIKYIQTIETCDLAYVSRGGCSLLKNNFDNNPTRLENSGNRSISSSIEETADLLLCVNKNLDNGDNCPVEVQELEGIVAFGNDFNNMSVDRFLDEIGFVNSLPSHVDQGNSFLCEVRTLASE